MTQPSKKRFISNIYNDEDEARTDGKKAGDIIFIYGVGKVKLK